MIDIRIAKKEDAGLIADISRETFVDTFAGHNTEADMDKFMLQQFTREQLMEEAGKNENLVLLAYENDQCAGYVFLKNGAHKDLSSQNAIEISRLYARKDFIGKGVGRALMLAAISIAKEQKKDTIWLGVWEHNLRAIHFYTSFGYRKFAEQDFILGDDLQHDHVMQLKIH